MMIKCPTCGFENIQGEDGCAQCLHSLMQRDLPKPHKHDNIQRAIMTTPVVNLLTGKDLLVASPSDTVRKIVKAFQKEEKDCVLVYKRKKLVGILSNRDLLKKVAGKFPDLSKIKIEQIMTPCPEWMKGDDPIAFAVNKMAVGGCRQVPVLRDDGTPLSIVTIKDVLSYLSRQGKTH